MKKELIQTQMKVKDNLVGVMRVGDVDYISLTDFAKYKNDKYPANVIIHWLSNKDTALYVGLWEELNNENFNLTEYREIKINEIGTASYTMSPKQWIQRTNAIGLISKGGKYSIGTYAHPDLAFEFASWLSVEFKLYLIREFERLKKNESYQNKIEWSVRRELAKTLFGMTAKEWKDNNPELEGNMRDYANILQLVILGNLENLNAEMIEQGLEQSKRLERLNTIAQKQYITLQGSNSLKKIESLDDIDNRKILN